MGHWVKTVQNSTDYSLQSTIKQVLYLAASRAEIQGQTGNRHVPRAAGDVHSAAVFRGTHYLMFRIPQLALVSAGIGVLWLLLAVSAGSHFRGRAPGDGR